MIPRDSTGLQLLQLIRCDDAGIIIHYLFIYVFTTPEGLSDVVRPSFEANRGSDTLRLRPARDLRAVTSITLTTSEARKSHETSAGSCNVQSGSSDFKPERFIGRTKGN